MMRLLFRLLAVTGLLVLGTAPGMAQTPAIAPGHVGSQTCSGCHESEGQAWKGSHHARAWTQPDETTILGDFDDAVFEHKGVTTHFTRRDGAFFVETEGADGAMRAFEVTGVVGVTPLQQYLVATQAGRLQALDIVWDIAGKRWYHLYPDQDLPPDDGLHWTGPYKTWNARCAECHATGFAKNYDPRSHRYDSTQAEIGVGCEGCHGPGEAHVAWARAPGDYDATHWSSLTAEGLTIGFATGSPETEIEQCAGCHSRREPFGDGNPLPGTAFHDAYRLALLRAGLYHADGQIDDEVYVLGSFLQSKMYARGVQCSICHDPHSANLVAEGDTVCTQCHNPQGQPRFPTMVKAAYDVPEHHKHPPGSAGARCVSCHMPAKTYMIVDPRRDHSFRVPRPDLSVKIGTPNACTGCHTANTAEWAFQTVKTWYPEGRWRAPHYGEVIHAGRTRNDAETTKALIVLAGNRKRPAIVRASAVQLLGTRLGQQVGQALTPYLEDSEPLVRRAAVVALGTAPRSVRARLVAPRMTDPVRSVRIAAARATVDIPLTGLTAEERHIVEASRADLRATMLALADFPETQMQIGGLAMALRNLPAADAAFHEAARMDPQLIDAWMSRARIALAQRDPQGAAAILGDGLEVSPESALLRQSRGNVLIQLGALGSAQQELNEAARLSPDEPSILIDIATIHTLRGENEKALDVLTEARGKGADGPDILDLLAVTYRRLGRLDEAGALAQELAKRFPQYERRPEVEELLKGLE